MADITAKEIARRMGISAAAVSMALNGKPGVSEETRARVLQEAARCGYSTPRAAKAAAKGSKNLTFVIYVGAGVAAATSFSAFVLKGVESQAKKLGYRVVVDYIYEAEPLEAQFLSVAKDTCGLILLGTDITRAQRDILLRTMQSSIHVPLVVVDNFLFAAYVDCVGNDNMFGSKAAVSHLIRCGHRHIGYLRSRQRIANFEDRQVGIHIAFEENAALALAPLQVVDVDIASEKAYEDICRWLDAGNRPASAYFAENDVLAAAAIRAFQSRGLRVPEDISIIGFDDISLCEMMQPAITTMHSFKERLGEMSVQFLIERIESGAQSWKVGELASMKVSVSLYIKERESVILRSPRHDSERGPNPVNGSCSDP